MWKNDDKLLAQGIDPQRRIHMSDDNLTFVPPSFIALYLGPSQSRPRIPKDEIAQRYELCEDLAQLLTETASHMLHTLHITEGDVLYRCLVGLMGEGAVVTPDEAQWVIRRLAELMHWQPLPGANGGPEVSPDGGAVSQAA